MPLTGCSVERVYEVVGAVWQSMQPSGVVKGHSVSDQEDALLGSVPVSAESEVLSLLSAPDNANNPCLPGFRV
ncbi:hypothetical protein J1614_007263 [Plenodomus biglobosus]|nr:hypothetical protein J1614_007263 [Plenodomus biglobosus]